MLAALLPYTYFPEWSTGPLVINIFTFIVILLLLPFRSSTRNGVGFSAFVGALSGLIYSIITKIATRDIFLNGAPAAFIFYAIFISFAFVPGLIGFYRISKPSSLGRNLVYFGYLWALIIIVIGLALTIIIAMAISDRGTDVSITDINGMLLFIQYSGWGFVAAYLLLLGLSYSDLSGVTRNSLLIYSALNILSVLVATILINSRPVSSDFETILRTIFAVSLVFCDITTATALILATYYGHLWTSESEATDDEKV